jgi:seryl-tRNA(Sec) selenium transferase
MPRRDEIVPLEEAHAIGTRHGVPVIADAASQIYPLDYMTRNASEPDLTCFGSKYFGAPHSTGFVCGRKDLVDSVAAQGFIGYHTGGRIAIGRALKVDRQDVMAVVTALDAWFSMNHEDRLMENDRRLSGIRAKLQGIPGVTATVDQRKRYWGFTLLLKIGPDAGKTAAQVVKELDEGTPRILVETEGDDTVTVVAHTLNEGEEDIVADRLIEVLSG